MGPCSKLPSSTDTAMSLFSILLPLKLLFNYEVRKRAGTRSANSRVNYMHVIADYIDLQGRGAGLLFKGLLFMLYFGGKDYAQY